MSFIPLADYKPPALPTEEWLRKLAGRAQAVIKRDTHKPFIAADQLTQATRDELAEIVAPPACGPLLAEVNQMAAEWSGAPVKLVVLPPGEETPLLAAWAKIAGHRVLEPPPLEALISRDAVPVPEFGSDGILVIPRLEAWFLRHRNGLRAVRQLLAGLNACSSRVMVGCNSAAWAFLTKAASADQLLPDPVIFEPFDDARLHAWFGELAEADSTAHISFRRASSGADVLALGEDGKLTDDFLRVLAGHSLGIPWIAWHLWRRSLRSEHKRDVDAGQPDQQTLWVAALDEYTLPGKHDQAAFLVLHALLVHGALSAEQLRLVLPLVGESSVVSVLIKAGFVERRGSRLTCRAAAYPAIHAGLTAGGVPLGAI